MSFVECTFSVSTKPENVAPFFALSSFLLILDPLGSLFRHYEQVGITTKKFEKDSKLIEHMEALPLLDHKVPIM